MNIDERKFMHIKLIIQIRKFTLVKLLNLKYELNIHIVLTPGKYYVESWNIVASIIDVTQATYSHHLPQHRL